MNIKRVTIRNKYYWQLRSNKGKLLGQRRYKAKDKEEVFRLAKENGSFHEDVKNKMISPNGKVIEHTFTEKKNGRFRKIPKREGRQYRAITSIYVDNKWVHGSSQAHYMDYPEDVLIEEATDNMISNLGHVEGTPDGSPYDESLRAKRLEKLRLSDTRISFVYYTKI